jgi:kumamolisin
MSNRKVFHDSVVALPEQPGVTPTGLHVNTARKEQLDEMMTVSFSLEIPKALHDDLEARVAAGQVVSVNDLHTKYTVPQAEVDPLLNWLKEEGFKVIKVSDDRTSVIAQASAAQIGKSLEVQLVRVTKNGITYTAARNAPSLPADIAGSVHAIGGLQNFRHAHKHLRRGSSLSLGPTPKVANQPPYLVAEILKAYNATDLGVTGQGQTIAILIDRFPLDTDLQAFWHANNVPVTLEQIQKINVNDADLPPPEGEETLDVSWTSGIAPGATVRIYASGSLEFTALDIALDRILSDLPSQPGMRQLSISLGLGETFMVPGEVRTEHQRFLRLAAAGVNVFVSSGDAGSNPDTTGQMSDGPLQAEYSASDSAVIGVGGTSLVLNANGSVAQETGWPGSGGGKSKFKSIFQRPTWQKGQGVPAGTQRLVPDVSATADPNEGAFLILHGQQVRDLGGTSWSAPVWAGLCALINEARIKANKQPLPFLNPLIYPLLGTADFRDIVEGNNGAFDAGPGYDMVTGLGVPNIKQLIATLTQ